MNTRRIASTAFSCVIISDCHIAEHSASHLALVSTSYHSSSKMSNPIVQHLVVFWS